MKEVSEKAIYFFLIISLFTISRISAQENPVFQDILGKLRSYATRSAPEKVYVQTDKDFYVNGETIWFKAYLLNGISHLASTKSKVVYVDLLDTNDSLVAQRKLYADNLGASGDIKITDEVETGNYLLRAYTQYMLNSDPPVFFQKIVPIWVQDISADRPENTSSKEGEKRDSSVNGAVASQIGEPVVRLFPEGGDLVTGLESAVGVKVTDAQGNGVALEGSIIDQNDKVIAPFRSHDFGLGITHFTPMANHTYYAHILVDGAQKKYPLPAPLPKGYVLQVRNLDTHIFLKVATNKVEGLKGTLLLGHLRGNIFFKRIEEKEGQDSYTVKLLTSELVDGVAQFTLFTADGEPVCERLVFIDNPENDVEFSVTTDKKEYGFREKVKVALKLTDKKGTPLNGDFSMGVVSGNGLDKGGQDIRSWLLLESDLGGTVQDAGYFFKDDSNARKYLLDALTLTHGWRRFLWKEWLTDKVSRTPTFPAEEGIMITGRTTAFKNRYQPKKTLTTLTVFGSDIFQKRNPTNAQGKFSFGPFVFQDTLEAIVEAADLTNVKNKDFSIYVDPPFPKIDFTHSKKRNTDLKTITYPQPYLEEAYRKKVNDFKYGSNVTQLTEVVVEAKKKTRQERVDEAVNAMTLYGNAQNRLFPDSIPGMQSADVFDVIRRVPGVQVLGGFPNQRVIIRGISTISGSTDPLFLLDGSPVTPDFIQGMRATEVMFIDVLKGAEAAIYGSRSANGVIAVYTKRGLNFDLEQERYPGVTNFEVPGFYKTRQFYSPNYGIPNPEHKKPDLRTTLHWNPDLRLKGQETSTVNFYTGDNSGSYVIKVEGITNTGKPLVGMYTLEVQDN